MSSKCRALYRVRSLIHASYTQRKQAALRFSYVLCLAELSQEVAVVVAHDTLHWVVEAVAHVVASLGDLLRAGLAVGEQCQTVRAQTYSVQSFERGPGSAAYPW